MTAANRAVQADASLNRLASYIKARANLVEGGAPAARDKLAMMIFRTRPAAALAIAAALSLTATPAFARGGWGDRHHHRGDGIDAGDLFAGLLVIGGIAAIASAAGKDKETREADYRYPSRDPRAQDAPAPTADYGEPRDDRGAQDYGYRPGDLNGAVDSCVGEIERGDSRVDSVDTVGRDGDGWRVQGRTGGRDFTCFVDRDGGVRNVDVE